MPESGLGLRVKVLKMFEGVPSLLGSGTWNIDERDSGDVRIGDWTGPPRDPNPDPSPDPGTDAPWEMAPGADPSTWVAVWVQCMQNR